MLLEKASPCTRPKPPATQGSHPANQGRMAWMARDQDGNSDQDFHGPLRQTQPAESADDEHARMADGERGHNFQELYKTGFQAAKSSPSGCLPRTAGPAAGGRKGRANGPTHRRCGSCPASSRNRTPARSCPACGRWGWNKPDSERGPPPRASAAAGRWVGSGHRSNRCG